MNHYCLCCAHCPKIEEFEYDGTDFSAECIAWGCEVWLTDLLRDEAACDYYTPRPEPQLTHCIEVLKLLGVEVE